MKPLALRLLNKKEGFTFTFSLLEKTIKNTFRF